MKYDEPVEPCPVCHKAAFLESVRDGGGDHKTAAFRFRCEGDPSHKFDASQYKDPSTMLCDRCARDVEKLKIGFDTQGTALCETCENSGPSIEDLVEQDRTGSQEALDGCTGVEPDGFCTHGLPTWLRWLGII